MKDIINPSMRKQLPKIIDKIIICYSTIHYGHPQQLANGLRRRTSKSLHIIFKLKNSKWDDTHIYFSDLDYSTKEMKKIEYEFKRLKEFFEEEEK